MLLVDDLAAGGTKNLRHTPRGLVTLDMQIRNPAVCDASKVSLYKKMTTICLPGRNLSTQIN